MKQWQVVFDTAWAATFGDIAVHIAQAGVALKALTKATAELLDGIFMQRELTRR